MTAGSERISFAGAGGEILAARLDLPAGAPRAFALFAHCFTCSKDIHAASRISRALAGEGMAVLRFDFTGLGHSEGEFANTNFSSNIGDLVAAADFLRARYEAPRLLVGHSLGGAAVLAAAARIPEAAAVATVGAPFDPAHLRHLIGQAVPEIEAKGEAEVEIAGRRFRVRRQFLDDISAHNMQAAIHGLGRALLVFHSPRDRTVELDNARLIFEAARHPKSFVSLDDADHLLSRPGDALYVAQVLAAWARRYLDSAAAGADSAKGETAPPPLEPGVVLIEETGDGHFAQWVRVGGHVLRADEPARLGGGDSGLSPYDFLVAGLGACTSMTLRMYADRKGWPLDHLAVRLRHRKVHAEDCEECDTKEGHIDRIERDVEIIGPLDESQRARLLDIADRCPVHRTLTSEVVIRTRLSK
jgi:putative redox protein